MVTQIVMKKEILKIAISTQKTRRKWLKMQMKLSQRHRVSKVLMMIKMRRPSEVKNSFLTPKNNS